MERIKQSRAVDVQRGLLLVRYATADDERRPPKVVVVVNPKDEKNIELVLNPDHKEAALWQPGSCLVVRATRPGKLLVEVIPVDVSGSTAATVKIEALSQGDAVAPRVRSAVVAVPDANTLAGLRLLGHVAGLGDVSAGADQWIAGPTSPARIEGMSIDWPGKPDGLDVRYSVRLARPHATSGRMMELGGYAGTRGRALPIVGVAVELTGDAANFQLSAEAVFLGAPVMRAKGRKVDMSGSTGREALVGFRLRVEEINLSLQPVARPVVKAKPSGRVRVFRSRSAQNELRSTLQSFCATAG